MASSTQILKKFARLTEALSRYPTRAEMLGAGISRDEVRRHFGNQVGMLKAAKEEFPESFESMFSSEEFTKQRMRETKADLRQSKEFIITTAVAGCSVHAGALAALKAWKKKTGGEIVMQPIADPARPRESSGHMFFDTALADEHFLWEDVKLNNKVVIHSILQSAKQLNPHTGLSRIVDNTALTVVASPKRRLTPLANMEGQPGYLISGGAITLPDYLTDMYMSERTARFGEEEHKLGGVYVKIIGQNRYEFTNITFDKDTGDFAHNGKLYKADGKIEVAKVNYLSFGDLHIEEMHAETFNAIRRIIAEEKPEEIDIQDIFSGVSCSPFNSGKPEVQYLEAEELNTTTVKEDLDFMVAKLNVLFSGTGASTVKTVNIVDSNHHKFLEYWITSGKYRRGDHRNILFAHKLAVAWLENPKLPILQSAVNLLSTKLGKCEFFTGIDSLAYAGVERLQHGHTDSVGRRNPPLDRLQEELGPCNVGHAHTSAIVGEAYRVGTMSGIAENRPAYARQGANKWSQSYIRGYENGQRQLVHIVCESEDKKPAAEE
jgi:hypothetical protein